jgi:hypothetical protein
MRCRCWNLEANAHRGKVPWCTLPRYYHHNVSGRHYYIPPGLLPFRAQHWGGCALGSCSAHDEFVAKSKAVAPAAGCSERPLVELLDGYTRTYIADPSKNGHSYAAAELLDIIRSHLR